MPRPRPACSSRARLAPQLQQAAAHHRMLHAVGRIQIPGIARATRAAARLVVRQVGTRARIVGLLRLPGDDAALDVDLPRARAGAVHPMRGADDFVVLPALRGSRPPSSRSRSVTMPWPSEKVSTCFLKKVSRSRKWLITNSLVFGGIFVMLRTPCIDPDQSQAVTRRA